MKRKKVQRELPPVGTELEATHKRVKYKARVVEDKKSPVGRSIKFKGRLYHSMSSAAHAFTNFPVNGWRYWKF